MCLYIPARVNVHGYRLLDDTHTDIHILTCTHMLTYTHILTHNPTYSHTHTYSHTPSLCTRLFICIG
jgi:hypothetical protein